MRRMLALLFVAAASEPLCPSPATPEVTAEVERLLAAAAEHASVSSLCMDGDATTVEVLVTCVSGAPGAVTVRYRVTTRHSYGGECAPYPECAKPPPPVMREGKTTLVFRETPTGLLLNVPAKLPEIAMTPLSRVHDGRCSGKKAAFVPKPVSRRR